MKNLHTIFLLLFVLVENCFSQTSSDSVFYLNKLPSEGILLDKGWKFHAGDNPKWARLDFNDSDWKFINPTVQLHNSPEVKKAEIGWFRLKLNVNISLTEEALAMLISTAGASEIYLNGQLIYRFGTVSKLYKKETTRVIYSHPYSLKLAHQSLQILGYGTLLTIRICI